MAYYKISHVDGRVTNPEQRIASDVPKFCSELSDLVQEDLTAVTDGLLYTWRLCSYASPKYIFWILVSQILSSIYISLNFVFCVYKTLKYSGDTNVMSIFYVLGLCTGSRDHD